MNDESNSYIQGNTLHLDGEDHMLINRGSDVDNIVEHTGDGIADTIDANPIEIYRNDFFNGVMDALLDFRLLNNDTKLFARGFVKLILADQNHTSITIDGIKWRFNHEFSDILGEQNVDKVMNKFLENVKLNDLQDHEHVALN